MARTVINNADTGLAVRTALNAMTAEVYTATPGTTATFTATLTNNSAVLSVVSDFTNISVGRAITGTGVEAGSVVSSIDSGAATITLSKVCKGTTASARTFTVEIGYGVAGAPAPATGKVFTDGGWDNPQGYSPLYNYSPAQVRKFLYMQAQAIAGKFGGYGTNSNAQPAVASSNVLVFGDSKVCGNGPAATQPLLKHAPYNIMASILNAQGAATWRADAASFTAGFSATSYAIHDPRMSFSAPADWTSNGSDASLITALYNASTTSSMTFTPGVQCDSFDIIMRIANGSESFSWSVNGGAANNVTPGGTANRLYKLNVSAGSLASNHTITIARISGEVRVVAIIPRDSTTYSMNVLNFGIGGASLSQRDSRTASSISGIPAFNTIFSPALVIQQWGYTDIGDNATPLTSIATTIGYYNNEIDRWQAQNVPVVVVSPSPWDDVNLYRDDASQRDYLRALKAMCVAQNVPMINMDDRWGSWQEAIGFLTHYARPDPSGNADIGYTVARALAAM